ncbi:MAG: heme lyase CcmF/NrfE family subunit, partial [Vibrio sp.]
GIMLGSWWAYYELGWGGFWFWDPVENASLMPWLASLALIHTLMIANHKKKMHVWSLILAIIAFGLSLLGTFIVRSGVLTSVHAFASDPTRGIALLAILSVIILVSFSLFALKASRYYREIKLTGFNRNLLVLIGVSLIVTGCAIVLLGTLYPMMFQAFDLGNISVGAPYFNFFFLPLTLMSCILIGLSYFIRRHGEPLQQSHLLTALVITLIIALGYALYARSQTHQWQAYSFWILLSGVAASTWVLVTSYFYMLRFITQQNYRGYAGILAHAGVALTLIGVCCVSFTSLDTQQKMGPGDSITLDGHKLIYQNTELLIQDNYTAEQANIALYAPDNELWGLIQPQKRHYTVRDMPMNEAGILNHGLSDWYVTLGDKLDSQHYAVRIQYKPLTNLLWYGAYLMIFGALAGLYHYVKWSRKQGCIQGELADD